MSETSNTDDKDIEQDVDDRPFIPDADAEQPEAAKFSRDESDHGRQDYGP